MYTRQGGPAFNSSHSSSFSALLLVLLMLMCGSWPPSGAWQAIHHATLFVMYVQTHKYVYIYIYLFIPVEGYCTPHFKTNARRTETVGYEISEKESFESFRASSYRSGVSESNNKRLDRFYCRLIKGSKVLIGLSYHLFRRCPRCRGFIIFNVRRRLLWCPVHANICSYHI